MKLWKEENQARQARPASDVIAKNLRGWRPRRSRGCYATELINKTIDRQTDRLFYFSKSSMNTITSLKVKLSSVISDRQTDRQIYYVTLKQLPCNNYITIKQQFL